MLPTLQHRLVYINGKAGNHLLEDAPAYVTYTVLPAEPDVGILLPYVEVEDLYSTTGRDLNRVLRNLDSRAERSITEAIT